MLAIEGSCIASGKRHERKMLVFQSLGVGHNPQQRFFTKRSGSTVTDVGHIYTTLLQLIFPLLTEVDSILTLLGISGREQLDKIELYVG